jgi:DNA repair exonuclease SbcCD nuclease subunit
LSARRGVRLLHTSDLHIGGEYGKTGPAWHGPECLCPIELVTRAARNARSDVLLVAGDLFDNPRISDEMAVAAMRLFGAQPYPTVILPGNHDPHDESSLYLRPALGELPAHVRVFREPDGECIALPDLSLSLWGRPTVIHEPSHRPLAGAPSRPNGGWYVVMAHGELMDEDSTRGSSPIHQYELAALDADYVALGHWDVCANVGGYGVPSWYSGSPCIGGGARTALLVDFADGGTQVAPLQLVARDDRECPGFAVIEG